MVAIAAIVAMIIYNVLPFDTNANKGLAVLFFIGVLWLTEALHVTITALLVVVIGALVGIPDFDAEIGLQSFANPTIYLFFGGFALAAALHVQQLDKKNRPKDFVIVWWKVKYRSIFDIWRDCVLVHVDIKHRHSSDDVAIGLRYLDASGP